MDWFSHCREAINNLFSAKLRSLLAILGVLVGTGSVVALISASQLATSHALAQFKTLGTNLLAMSLSNNPALPKTAQEAALTLDQVDEIVSSNPSIQRAAPYINSYQSMLFHGHRYDGSILAATEALADIAKIHIARGRFVSTLDRNAFYCVIGHKLAQQIRKQGYDPLYSQLQLGQQFFTIIGIAKPWSPNFFLYSNIDQGVIIPLQAAYNLNPKAEILEVLFRFRPTLSIQNVQTDLTTTLHRLLPSKLVQFRNPQQIIDIIGKQRQTFTWLLGAIGGISLLVGGIGVMNIMLVSVVERRREIGIRLAIGARQSDILKMFLIESIFLTVFGGMLGITLGILVSYFIAVLTKWAFTLYLLPPILGFAVSGLVGVISGFYPALRASRLDPIQTLQSD